VTTSGDATALQVRPNLPATPKLLGTMGQAVDPSEKYQWTGAGPEVLGRARERWRILRDMFERFTNQSRRVLVLAQEEARLLNHPFIGTEHILLGLIHEGDGLAAQALVSLGISLEGAREKVEEIIGVAGTPFPDSPPFTPRAKKVFEFSLREAIQLNHSYIGTEHLLLGVVRQSDGAAASVLMSLGADLSSVWQEVIRLMPGGLGPNYSQPIDDSLGSEHGIATAREWAPPVWDRPSEGTVPVVFAVNALVLQNDVIIVAIDRLEVFPNGFMINLLLRVDPRQIGEVMELLRPLGTELWPRVGVRFADGRAASGTGIDSIPDLARDEHGLPIEPFMSIGSHGGAPGGWRAWAWVFPLPPDGPLEIFVALETAGLAESSVTVDGTAINTAAEQAKVIWT
jgi:Clp amino terminal domain, pathogenicity island component